LVTYFSLKYGKHNGWVATLGSTGEQKFHPESGEEDFTEQSEIATYLEKWRPSNDWVQQPICLHFKARGRKLVKADRIFHNAVGPIVSENAVSKLCSLFERDGHILPLNVVNSEEKFYFWWVPWIENSVDLTRSEKFPNGVTIKRYAFNEDKIEDFTSFRPHYDGMYNPEGQGQVLVSEEFKTAWLDCGLTGIDFKQA